MTVAVGGVFVFELFKDFIVLLYSIDIKRFSLIKSTIQTVTRVW